ncbi:hypothetical protein Q7C36_006146 [Tachysurus vachellii]|uniref:SNF2 N-terminal domain-containing protein n=1 Tax=Tachysurus vachellii TaxID=175792 RepID=A0AA88NRS8_TACVA|nr:hypothetical protein Q7C36_006146 [Tachysurus vachellii]
MLFLFKAQELHRVLQPFLLCRFKDEVERDLPKKLEVVVYHGMSSLQKKYYKAIRNKDRSVFGQHQGKSNQLTNIQLQLRKCVCHPYLFNEPRRRLWFQSEAAAQLQTR